VPHPVRPCKRIQSYNCYVQKNCYYLLLNICAFHSLFSSNTLLHTFRPYMDILVTVGYLGRNHFLPHTSHFIVYIIHPFDFIRQE